MSNNGAAPVYAFNVPGDGKFNLRSLLTVGDEMPLLEGDFGSFTPSQTQTYSMPGIPDGLGYTEIGDLKYVWVNHELSGETTTDVQTSAGEGKLNGARVSLFVFDKDWNVIGGRNLIQKVVADGKEYCLNTETGNYEAADGTFLNQETQKNLSRFCSGYLAENGFDGGPIWFAPEETTFTGELNGKTYKSSDGQSFSRGWAVLPDGTAVALDGLGKYAKEQVYSASQYRTGNPSGKTVIISTEDYFNGEVYMYVGDQTADDPDGLTASADGSDFNLYVLRVKDAEGNVVANETFDENVQYTAEWVQVPDQVALADGLTLTQWVDTKEGEVLRSTNFRRPEDMHEDPNNPGTFYAVMTGTNDKIDTDGDGTVDTVDNSTGTLYRFTLNPDDPTGQIDNFELLMRGGPNTGVSYDNMTVDEAGNVLIAEDETAGGGAILTAQQRQGRVLSYNIAENEGVVEEDRVTFLFENNVNQIDPAQRTSYGIWESSGVVAIGDGSYLYDVQAHSIQDAEEPDGSIVGRNNNGDGDKIFYQGQYAEGGQLILATPIAPPKLIGFAALPADTLAEGPPAGGNNGEGEPISANDRTGPFAGQPVQGFSGVQFAPNSDGSSLWFLSDNGFGAKANSSDYLLRLYQVQPSFDDKTAAVEGFVQLADPDNLISFEIQNEGSEERLLTGSDFDVESFVIAPDNTIWVGDEFGPYLLHFDREGKLLDAPIATPNFYKLNTLNGQTPLVIGHRGASGSRPEHTLEAYKLAIEQGADFIEPDLVPTKDGVLIARHENALATVELDEKGDIVRDAQCNPTVNSATTNVADIAKFADRLTVKVIDGTRIGGWFSEDFTLAEIKELRARERIPQVRPDNTQYNDQFEIPTLAEVINLVKQTEAETGKKIGIYPETKHPTYFAEAGKFIDGTPIEINTSQKLVDTLVENEFTDPNRIFIQSFEVENLLRLQNEIMPAAKIDIPLVQLTDEFTVAPYDVAYNFNPDNTGANPEVYGSFPITFSAETTYGDIVTPEVLAYIGEAYAEGLGPWKNTFLLREPLDTPVDGNGDGVAEITTQLTGEVVPLIEWAHDAGLQVHPYTLRNEERYLTLNPDGTPQTVEDELKQLIQLGVDGFFTDFPGTGDWVRDRVVADEVRSPDHPAVLDGSAVSNLSRSRGFEGMAISPDGNMYPMLEGTVAGDPVGSLRIHKFDRNAQEYEGLVGYYQLEDPSHAIGDFTAVNEHEYLVIERDNNQADAAAFKEIFKVDLSQVDENGFVHKEELVNLLDISDPDDLNGDGSTEFKFPFQTIENVLVLDANTILVANDNNYPFSVGRPPGIDNSEFIVLQLGESLNLAEGVGLPRSSQLSVSTEPAGI